jgi:hypothetical protein
MRAGAEASNGQEPALESELGLEELPANARKSKRSDTQKGDG